MKTAVITTGGLGTRLLTCTKGNPKTMLPIYDIGKDDFLEPILKPLIEFIFENLYDYGFRRFCFIVGQKTKSSILNHMLPDTEYIKLLKKRNTSSDKRFIKTLTRIYTKIINSEIKWISQPTPMGFGDALLKSSRFVDDNNFLLHTGDAYFPNYHFLYDFIKTHENNSDSSCTLLLQRKKSVKGLGIAQIKTKNHENIVFNVEEKPKKPLSNLAILPLYIFTSDVFKALKKTPIDYNGELQVTDAIKTLIKWDKKIIAYNYGKNPWFDIGTPENYFKSLKFSYNKATKISRKFK